MMPLTYLTTLNSLRHLSLVSVCAVIALVAVLALRGFTCEPTTDVAMPASSPPLEESGTHGSSAVLPPLAWWTNVVSAVPVYVCIFICSFSALPLDTEVREEARDGAEARSTHSFVSDAWDARIRSHGARKQDARNRQARTHNAQARTGDAQARTGDAQARTGPHGTHCSRELSHRAIHTGGTRVPV